MLRRYFNAFSPAISTGGFATVSPAGTAQVPLAINPAEWAQTPALGEMIVSPFMMLYATGPWFIFAMFGAWAFWKRRSTDPGKLFWVAWFAASMVGIYAAGRFFAHYYVILFPIMALLIPAGIVYVRDRWQGRRARLVVWSLLVISLLIPVGLNAYIYFQPTEAARHEQKFFNIDRAKWETQSQDLAAWFDARTTPDDYLYDLGFQVDVLFYADRQSPTRFVFDYPFWLDHGFEQEAIADLQAHSPKFIFNSPLDEPNNPGDGYYPRDLYNWIQQNYDYLGKVYYANVWQLKGTSQAPGS